VCELPCELACELVIIPRVMLRVILTRSITLNSQLAAKLAVYQHSLWIGSLGECSIPCPFNVARGLREKLKLPRPAGPGGARPPNVLFGAFKLKIKSLPMIVLK